MTPQDWAIGITAIGLIAFVNWFFLGAKGTSVAVTAPTSGGVIDGTEVVDGGDTPSTTEVPAGTIVGK